MAIPYDRNPPRRADDGRLDGHVIVNALALGGDAGDALDDVHAVDHLAEDAITGGARGVAAVEEGIVLEVDEELAGRRSSANTLICTSGPSSRLGPHSPEAPLRDSGTASH